MFTYDPGGNRISKSVVHSGDTLTTWYVRDAQGNVLSVYTYGDPAVHGKDLTQTELHIYGSSRLGILKPNVDVYMAAPASVFAVPLLGTGDSVTFVRGNKFFELTNHLGNVLVTISDKRCGVTPDSVVRYFIPDVVSANDYYPFGSPEPGRSYTQSGTGYRYGFNGKEKDDEVKGAGDQIDYGMRVYDPRVGRFLSVDPLAKQFPQYSPYHFSGNKPIWAIDLDGREDVYYTVNVVKNGLGQAELRSIGEDENKAVHWFNSNKTGKYGEGSLFTYRIETQDMDGRPVSIVTIKLFVPKIESNIFQRLFGSESNEEKIGYVIYANGHDEDFSNGFPKAGPGSEVIDMKDWFGFVGGLRTSATVEDLAEDYSKSEAFKKVITKLFQINDLQEKIDQLKEHVKGEDESEKPKGGETPSGLNHPNKPAANSYTLPPTTKTKLGGDSSTNSEQKAVKEWNNYYRKIGTSVRSYIQIRKKGDTTTYNSPDGPKN